ncbi:MAG TPA: hypothetical protein VME66_00465 [Candidatus Acidoferrales bacterium]|nr:hypothetical protein [Candidatus Acidoferrales bacterium]
MSAAKKSVELTRSQERTLDEFAKTSDFWSRVRSAYAAYGGLTERQHELFQRQLERDAWKADAQRLGGIPIRNRFRTTDGKPRCADRAKPYCESAATIIVGSFAFCERHAPTAKGEHDEWLASRREENARRSSPHGRVAGATRSTAEGAAMHSPLATAHHRVIGCYREIAVQRAGDDVLISIETHRKPVAVSLGADEALLMADALERNAYLRYALGEGRALVVEPFADTGIANPTCGLTHAHTNVTIHSYGTCEAVVQLSGSACEQLVMTLLEAAE